MPIVNFNINPALDKKIKKFIKEEGFSSKAEFFRFSAMRYMSVASIGQDEIEAKRVIAELKEAVVKKYAGKKLPSSEEQLRDV